MATPAPGNVDEYIVQFEPQVAGAPDAIAVISDRIPAPRRNQLITALTMFRAEQDALRRRKA